jgi:hypothetical protein
LVGTLWRCDRIGDISNILLAHDKMQHVIMSKTIEAEPLHLPQIERASLVLSTGLTDRLR